MHYRNVLCKFGHLVMDGADSTTTKHSGATTNNLVTYQLFTWALDAVGCHSNDSLDTPVVSKNEVVATSVELVALPPSSSGMQGFISRCVFQFHCSIRLGLVQRLEQIGDDIYVFPSRTSDTSFPA